EARLASARVALAPKCEFIFVNLESLSGGGATVIVFVEFVAVLLATNSTARNSRNQNYGPLCSLECGSLLPLWCGWNVPSPLKRPAKRGALQRRAAKIL